MRSCFTQNTDTIDLRKKQVHDQNIGLGLLQEAYRSLAIRCNTDDFPIGNALQGLAQTLAKLFAAVRDQDLIDMFHTLFSPTS